MKDFPSVFSLAGKKAVITGGATGLGFGTAQCMLRAGAEVIIIGRREQLLQQSCEELGEGSSWICADITQTDNTDNLVQQILDRMGHIDILVNNAGNQYKKPIEQMSVDEYKQVLNTHLVGSFALTKAVLPFMRSQKSGSVIFMASMCSYIGNPNLTGYASAKAGVLGLMRTLASEASCDGVRFNAIAPGWIETPMFQRALGQDPARRGRILARTPMNKFGTPEDIGWAAVFLASDASSFITGTSLIVDGGAVIGL